MIIDDLVRIPIDVRVIVEGFRLLPHLVKPLLSAPSHAVWLLPSPEFREARLSGGVDGYPAFLRKQAILSELYRICSSGMDVHGST
jgi:hypothetical protein